jgi:hypothetical protein
MVLRGIPGYLAFPMADPTGMDAAPDPHARLRALLDDAGLRDEGNFLGRSEAAEELESACSALRAEWEALDAAFFGRLRAALRAAPDRCLAFRRQLDAHVPLWDRPTSGGETGYDTLDLFLNGLLHPDPLPEEVLPLEPGMVAFQKTPARIALDMVRRARLGPGDRFFDVGSGFGQIPILVHLLSGARVVGIEREPAYAAYARACALGLGLAGTAEFPVLDARAADFAEASVLYLFTPFRGPMLDEVLDRIRRQCPSGTRLFAFGPCAAEVARMDWLLPLGPAAANAAGLAAFAMA